MQKIKIKNNQGIKLKGYYHKSSSPNVILYIPGLAGAYDELAQAVGLMCENENIGFCFAYNQGSGEIKELVQIENGVENTVIKGSCFENFESIVPDIDCFVEFLKNEEYENIYFVGHSMGNDKSIYYLNNTKRENVKALVLLAPQDMRSITQSEYHKSLYQEAQDFNKLNNGTQILSKPFMGFCKMSANTLCQYNEFEGLFSLPYRQEHGDWQYYNNVKVPKIIIMGEFDQGLDLTNGKTVYTNMSKFDKDEIVVINDAKHTFKHHESEVAENIKNFIRRF